MPLVGRPRKPTAVLEMSGAFQRNPQRRRARVNEPEVKLGVGDPPACFLIPEPESGYQEAARLKAIWEQIAEEGPWISRSSRGTVETLCRITDAIKRKAGKLPQLAVVEDKLRSSLGLTEASRSHVDAPKAPSHAGQSALEGLAQESRQARVG